MPDRLTMTAAIWDRLDGMNYALQPTDPATGGVLYDNRLGPVQVYVSNIAPVKVIQEPYESATLEDRVRLLMPVIYEGLGATLVLGRGRMWIREGEA